MCHEMGSGVTLQVVNKKINIRISMEITWGGGGFKERSYNGSMTVKKHINKAVVTTLDNLIASI